MNRIITLAILTIMTMSCQNLNPFYSEWTTPYSIPPFNEIKQKHFVRAVKTGIHRQAAEIDAIIARDGEPTFENTIEPYERSGAILDRVCGVLFNLSESDATPAMQKIVAKVIPMLTEHNDNIFMNPYFFKRVSHIYEKMPELGLTTEQEMTLKRLYDRFQANGIALNEEDQKRIREINKEVASLEQTFGNNILAQTNTFTMLLTDTSEIAGLPEAVLSAAAADAKVAGISRHDAAKLKKIPVDAVMENGPWLFTLHNPSYVPFMTYSAKRDLREKMFRAYSSRGNNDDSRDNKAVVMKIMELRIEKAKMLGYDIPADFILSDKMAGNARTVDAFLSRIFESGVRKAKEELVDLQAVMDEDVKAGLLPDDSTSVIRPWDWAYYAERVRKNRFDLDEDVLKPYFKMENVREGVFSVAHDLYGINIEKLDGVSLYHPDVEAFKVTDADSSFIGIFLTDYYPRSTKRGGAWMNNFKNQEVDAEGNDIRPIIVNVGNFTKPTPDKPSLLTLDEVSTMFHEFGHALHGLLSKCTYKDVSGTSVARDFVELPSQINENWAFRKEVLSRYARHYQTGEVIPDSLVTKISNSSKFNQGFMTTELAAASILDMKWHSLPSLHVPADCPYASDEAAPESEGLRLIDPIKFEEYVMKEAGLIEEIIPRYRTTYFNHIFSGGYSAGYYSYLWAEVLDKDAFELFRQKGIFNKEVSMSFRRNILEKGGSEDPMVLYRRFRGADPNPSAMLKARGLVD